MGEYDAEQMPAVHLETDEVSYLGTALGSPKAFPLEAYFGPGGGAGPRRDEPWSLFLIGGGGENTKRSAFVMV